MKEIVLDQKDLTNFDKRADYEKRRAAVYAQWGDLVAARQRDVLHRSLLGALLVLGIVLIGFFFDSWLERLLGKLTLDRRQVGTLPTVTSIAAQVAGRYPIPFWL